MERLRYEAELLDAPPRSAYLLRGLARTGRKNRTAGLRLDERALLACAARSAEMRGREIPFTYALLLLVPQWTHRSASESSPGCT